MEIIRVLHQHCSRLELGTPGALHLDHTDEGLQQVNFFSMIQKIVCGDNWPSVGSMMIDIFMFMIIHYLFQYFIQFSTLKNVVC